MLTWDFIKNKAKAFKKPEMTGSLTTWAILPNLK